MQVFGFVDEVTYMDWTESEWPEGTTTHLTTQVSLGTFWGDHLALLFWVFPWAYHTKVG